ncbi:LLM class flavin-dependent oxidoreductase [Pseudonocardia sp.]|uniref:LLM class flavin-dependent oxidoreductase n=1 Tax=Pseudonocardia sp. TaxID=60912 RepID=UPI003D129F0D
MTGIAVTPLETRRDVVVHVARRAEELGYASMHVAEGWGLDAGALLAEIAVRTERIRLATGVLNVWGRSPATVAMLATTLDDISGGRFTLGLGSGSPQLAEGLHDTPFDAPVRRLEHTTRQVRRLLAGERLVPAGEHGGRPLRLATDPRPDVPIHLAGLGPAAVELAGEVADGWCPFLLPVSGLPEYSRRLEKGAARAGRPRPDVVLCPPVAVAPTRDQARELASWWVSFYLTRMGPLYRRTLERAGYADAVAEVVNAAAEHGPTVPASAEVLLDELVVWGEPDAARARLDRWRAAGAEQLALVLPPQRPVEELDAMLEAMRPEPAA